MELIKQVESEYVDKILEGLQKYWNYRANSYSKSNIEELNNFKISYDQLTTTVNKLLKNAMDAYILYWCLDELYFKIILVQKG